MQSVKEEWKKEYSRIVEEHTQKVAKGLIKPKEFVTKEELFTYLHNK